MASTLHQATAKFHGVSDLLPQKNQYLLDKDLAEGASLPVQVRLTNNFIYLLSTDKTPSVIEKLDKRQLHYNHPSLMTPPESISLYVSVNRQLAPLVTLSVSESHPTLPSDLASVLRKARQLSECRGPLSFNPVMRARPSPLSNENETQNFRGFLNLAFIILFVVNFRLCVENFLKYGVLIKFELIQVIYLNWEALLLIVPFSVYYTLIILAYLIQKAQFHNVLGRGGILVLNVINVLLSILVPLQIIRYLDMNPFINLPPLMVAMILTFKLISYAHVMRHLKFVHSGLVSSFGKDPHYQPTDDVDHNLIGPENL